MSIRPVRFSEKCYAAVLLYHGSVQVALYLLDASPFLLRFGVGVWVCLLALSVVFSALTRANATRDPWGGVGPNTGSYP